MTRPMTPARRAVLSFWLRFALLFATSWVPVPWFPDAYSATFALGANAFLSIVTLGSQARLHMEPPPRLRMIGSWKPTLVVEEPGQQPQRAPINVKTFSYRPLATFLALALASTLDGRRRKVIVLGGGFALMVVITTALTALPTLTELAVRGRLGSVAGWIVATSYIVLMTPLMVYLIPLLVWWLLMWRTRPNPSTPQT